MSSGRVGKAIVLTCFFMAGYGRHRKLGVGFRTAGYGRHRSQWVKCIQLLLQSHLCILKKTHFELNRFKDDNVKIVFASTLHVFLLVIKTCSRFCLLPLGMPNHHPLR